MIKEKPENKKDNRKIESVKTGDLEKAIERIHQEYGNDLQAFFRDAKEAALKRNAKLHKRETFAL